MFSASRLRFVGLLALSVGVLVLPQLNGRAAATCTGDCNDDGEVTVTELIKGVNIALESAPLDTCPAFDVDGDGVVTVNEIVAAVNYALTACPVEAPTVTPTEAPTPTATPESPTETPTVAPTPSATVAPTETPTAVPPTALATATEPPPTATEPAASTPTASQTPEPTGTATQTLVPTPVATDTPVPTATASETAVPTATATAPPPTPAGASVSAAGAAVMVANGMSVIPSVITAIISGNEFSSSSSLLAPVADLDGGAAATGQCPKGGTATRTTVIIPPGVNIALTDCAVDTADGRMIVNGTVSLGLLSTSLNADIQIRFTDDSGTTTKLNQTAKLNGTFSLSTSDPQCYVKAATLQLSNGTLSSLVPGANGAGVSFNGTMVAITVNSFNSDCVPVTYTMRFNGPATVSMLGSDGKATGSFAATFSNLDVAQDASKVPTENRLDGGLSASCVGGAATLATQQAILQAVGTLCPIGGVLRVTAAGTTGDVLYLAGGGVGIDTPPLDGKPDVTYPTCLDAALLQCVGGM